jgi:uncharacterized protein with HEPN domain
MPDQSSAADEHAILQEITAPLASLPDDVLPAVADVDFPRVLRGYDPLAVDAYVKKTTQLVAELQTTRSPEAAVRRALERVGEQISGILQRAHETAEQITSQSRREAEDRLVQAREEARQIAAAGEQRIKDLDADADRIWAERLRIVDDARELAAQLTALADAATERFPPAEDTGGIPAVAEEPAWGEESVTAGGEESVTAGGEESVTAGGAEPVVGGTGAPVVGGTGEPAAAEEDGPAVEEGGPADVAPALEVELFDAEAVDDPDATAVLPVVEPPEAAPDTQPPPAPPPAQAPAPDTQPHRAPGPDKPPGT